LSKIGTGEGAQAYGHGLYFAENEGVARSYRDALTKAISGVEIDGRPIESAGISPGARQIAQMVADGTTTLDQLKSINAASLARYENQLKANPNSQIAQMNRDQAIAELALQENITLAEIQAMLVKARGDQSLKQQEMGAKARVEAEKLAAKERADQVEIAAERERQPGPVLA